MRYRLACVALVLVSSFPGKVHAQALWSGILDPSRAIDWTNAGVVGGIPSGSWTQCGSTIAAGATASTIQTAINNCTANHYVLLAAGTFNLTNGLVLKSNVVLRGAGANQTILNGSGTGGASCYSGGAIVCLNNGVGDYNGSAAAQPGGSQASTWSGGYAQGASSITLTNIGSTGIVNGQYIFLDQASDTAPTTGLFICDIGTTCATEGGSPGRTISGTVHSQLQVVKVTGGCATACTGAGPFTVTISPGLYGANWSGTKSPGAWWPSGMVQYAGVENLTIDTTGSSVTESIGIFNASNCWVSGVIFKVTPRAAVWIIQGAHNTVQNNYTYQTQSQASLGYGVEEDLTSDNLAVNNIMQQTVSPIMGGSLFGNVFAYNYQINDYETACPSCMYLSTLAHDAAAEYNLWEGNFAPGVDMDDVHGTSGVNTLFRNVFLGYDKGKSTYTMGVEIDPYNRYENVVGNVVGTPGVTLYYDDIHNPTQGANLEYMVYIVNQPHSQIAADAVVAQTLLRWGNYDNVTGAVRWCGNSSDTGWSTTCGSTSEVPTSVSGYPNAVPSYGDTGIGQQPMTASFAFASKPSWWPSGKAWPPIGPDVTNGNVGQCVGGSYALMFATSAGQCTGGTFTAHINGGHANSIPAMDCYFSLGGPPDGSGSALNFNAASCYSVTSATGPAPPTSLTTTIN